MKMLHSRMENNRTSPLLELFYQTYHIHMLKKVKFAQMPTSRKLLISVLMFYRKKNTTQRSIRTCTNFDYLGHSSGTPPTSSMEQCFNEYKAFTGRHNMMGGQVFEFQRASIEGDGQ